MPPVSKSALACVDGWSINAPNMDTAIGAAIAAASAGKPFTLLTLNLDHLVKLRRNERFRQAYRHADIVTADGAPVAWLARRQNAKIERTTGADMLRPLARAAASAGLPVFLFGSSKDVLAKAARELYRLTGGGIAIVGRRAPSAAFDPEGAEAADAIDRIAASGARLCFVALGAPKQEIFSERARASGLACGMICIGAAVDFVAGAQVRAPWLLRRSGFEWTWRLATDPRRFAKRYWDCAIVFAGILMTPFRPRLARVRT
jgi:exopolysaccharide biosynthesis WecB/TagA/CpsF family protein